MVCRLTRIRCLYILLTFATYYFIKRASEVCGVPRSTLKKWRQQYLNGIYTEVTNDDIESFRATLWRDQQEVLAQQAFGAAKKILEQINGLLNAQRDALHARDIKDMSLAFNKILGCVSGFTPGGQQAVSVSNVQIVLPPKSGELSHA
jgi:hypothetical protein